jgi:uncharacterized protein YciI
MLWAISCIDKPNSAALRDEQQKAFVAYLKKHMKSEDGSQRGIVFLTMRLLTDDGKENLGSMWIVNVNSRAEAKAFVDNTSFAKAGLFSSITITRVRKGQLFPELADD